MNIDQLESYSNQLATGVVDITEELHTLIDEVRYNESLLLNCDEAWEHLKSKLIKAINEIK